MTKCENIEMIELFFRHPNHPNLKRVLDSIAAYCPAFDHLKMLAFHSIDVFNPFFSSCGSKLRKLNLGNIWALNLPFLSHCVNVEEIIVQSNWNSMMNIFQGEQGLFPDKLRSIEGHMSGEDISSQLFASFCAKYKNSLRRIKVGIRESPKNVLLSIFDSLNQLNRIEFISLNIEMKGNDLLSWIELNEVKRMKMWSQMRYLMINGEEHTL
jgi:hypothetical protein